MTPLFDTNQKIFLINYTFHKFSPLSPNNIPPEDKKGMNVKV